MADTYTIPATGLGAIRSIALHELHGPTLARLTGTQDLPVTLHAAPHALQAQLADAPLGLLPAADRAEYPELDWLLDQGFTPEVTARITVDGLASSAALRLPRPGLLLPANNPPAQAWTLLPPGSPADAVTLMDLPDDIGIDKRSRLQLLTRLRALPDGGVEVYLGNHLAGRLPDAAAARLHPTIVAHRERGVIAVARAYYAPRRGERTLTVYAAPAEFDPTHVSPASPHQDAASSFETTTFLAAQGPRNTDLDTPTADTSHTWIWWLVAALILLLVFAGAAWYYV